MRFMDDESITGPKEFAVGNYLVQMVRSFTASCRADKPNSYIWWVTLLLDVGKKEQILWNLLDMKCHTVTNMSHNWLRGSQY